jgi:hypothetical protein
MPRDRARSWLGVLASRPLVRTSAARAPRGLAFRLLSHLTRRACTCAHAQVCTFICARLETSRRLRLVFSLKQLIFTAVYRGQLVVIKTRPRISYSVNLAPKELQLAGSVRACHA